MANDGVSLSIKPVKSTPCWENGAGKSTLMQILYGLYQADEGEIVVDGLPRRFRDPSDAIHCGIGMVHQEFMLVQPMTVVENDGAGVEEGIVVVRSICKPRLRGYRRYLTNTVWPSIPGRGVQHFTHWRAAAR
ncbi:ATP-binding cassette domain-containing protein (plasmid) [Pseudomonas silvicola]|nr:ATP-binding cassette domain-containing protein [Pseudomonas silvicola]